MKISELLKVLREKKKEHGDLVIRVYDPVWQAYFDISSKEINMVENKDSKFICLNTES